LVIAGNRGTGSVWVDGGSVVCCTATGTVADAGPADVLFELLRYADGSFTFEAGTTTPDAAPPRPVEILLADAERQLSEWRVIEAFVPSMDAWLSLVPEPEEGEIIIAAERWKTIVAIGSGGTVTAVGLALKLGELDICRQVKELVEQGLVTVTTTPVAAVHPADESTEGTGATAAWETFTIEIPGVEPVTEPSEPEWDDESDAYDDDDYVDADDDVDDDLSVIEDEDDDDDELEADEVARQLASLSPKAARAVAAASRTEAEAARDALEGDDDDDEPVDRGLLLKFLSSVKT
jgi:hypothetical protein